MQLRLFLMPSNSVNTFVRILSYRGSGHTVRCHRLPGNFGTTPACRNRAVPRIGHPNATISSVTELRVRRTVRGGVGARHAGNVRFFELFSSRGRPVDRIVHSLMSASRSGGVAKRRARLSLYSGMATSSGRPQSDSPTWRKKRLRVRGK